MLPEMKTIEPYSPMARANASANPVRTAGNSDGAMMLHKRAQPAGAERRGGFLHFALEILQHRLKRSHDERQADKGQRDHDPEPRVGALDAERHEIIAQASRWRQTDWPASGPQPRSARRRENPPSRRSTGGPGIVAHEHPGQQRAEDGVGQRRRPATRRKSVGRPPARVRWWPDARIRSTEARTSAITMAPIGMSTIALR